MYCPKCGWNNPDDAAKCANCFAELKPSQPQQPDQTQQMPPTQAPQQPYAAQQPYSQQPYAQQPYGAQPGQAVPDYMAWSIIISVVSLLCCWFLPVSVAFGIVAIVKSSQANSKKAAGDYFGALSEANGAKTWLWWAAGIDIAGLVFWILYIVFVIILASSGAMRHQL